MVLTDVARDPEATGSIRDKDDWIKVSGSRAARHRAPHRHGSCVANAVTLRLSHPNNYRA
jgi:hypothetical protein